jgi:hypothetical protein
MAHETIIKKLWARVMPAAIPSADEYNVFLWAKCDLNDVIYAIERTADKMRRNLKEGKPLAFDSALRYTSSVLRSRVEWRRIRCEQERKRIDSLAHRLATRFYPMEHLDFLEENVPPEYHTIREQRQVFVNSSRPLIEQFVVDGRTDEQIGGYMEQLHTLVRGDFRSTVLPKLKDGERRMMFSPRELLDFFSPEGDADTLLDAHDLVTRFGVDGRFAVDVISKSAQEVGAEVSVAAAL